MRETIELVVKALVDETDAVDVRELDREGMTRIEVRVAKSDMGKVIGKQGRTVRALRSLVYAAGVKQRRRFVLDVVE
ncbi:MAG TPA: KH domain-containing protein [Pyrinomonadaceae bacterium]|nr:KH domain-containing protein [Pyrinomonadaceae bacterium]